GCVGSVRPLPTTPTPVPPRGEGRQARTRTVSPSRYLLRGNAKDGFFQAHHDLRHVREWREHDPPHARRPPRTVRLPLRVPARHQPRPRLPSPLRPPPVPPAPLPHAPPPP